LNPLTDKHKELITKESRKGIEEIVGAIADPIIVMPGGWGDTLPEWIKTAITLERLIENMKALKGEEMTGTDAEACAYLYTASLTAPMGHDWVKIYLYIATKVMEKRTSGSSGKVIPDDIRVTELTRDQQDDLAHLKSWIYERRVKHRKGLERDERRETKARQKAGQPDDLQLAYDLFPEG